MRQCSSHMTFTHIPSLAEVVRPFRLTGVLGERIVEMAQEQKRIDALALYKYTSNIERARMIQKPEPPTGFCEKPTHRGISVVILNKDKPEYIVPLLRNILVQKARCAQVGVEIQLLVGDTGSTDTKVLAVYEELKNDCVIEMGLEYHFSRCNNLIAFSKAHCEYVLFLNNDIVFPDGETPFLSMFEHIKAHTSTGALGACLWYPNGTIQHAGIDFFRSRKIRCLPFHVSAREKVTHNALHSPGIVPAITGACLMMPSDLFERIGGMNERYTAESQDVDLCLSVRRFGFECECMNFGQIIHIENGTRPKGEENWADRRLFLRKWGAFIEADII